MSKRHYQPLQRVLETTHKLIEVYSIKATIQKLQKQEKKLAQHLARFFSKQGSIVVKAYKDQFNVNIEAYHVDDLFNAASDLDLTTEEFINKYTLAIVVDGAATLSTELALAIAFDLKNPRALEYAKQNAGEFITGINNTSRETINKIISKGVDQGSSYQDIAKQIQAQFTQWGKPVSGKRSRAELIAIDQTARAYQYGNYLCVSQAKSTGLHFEKRWSTVGDALVTPGCKANQDQDWINDTELYLSGHLYPPRFPGCRCANQYRRKKDLADEN